MNVWSIFAIQDSLRIYQFDNPDNVPIDSIRDGIWHVEGVHAFVIDHHYIFDEIEELDLIHTLHCMYRFLNQYHTQRCITDHFGFHDHKVVTDLLRKIYDVATLGATHEINNFAMVVQSVIRQSRDCEEKTLLMQKYVDEDLELVENLGFDGGWVSDVIYQKCKEIYHDVVGTAVESLEYEELTSAMDAILMREDEYVEVRTEILTMLDLPIDSDESIIHNFAVGYADNRFAYTMLRRNWDAREDYTLGVPIGHETVDMVGEELVENLRFV